MLFSLGQCSQTVSFKCLVHCMDSGGCNNKLSKCIGGAVSRYVLFPSVSLSCHEEEHYWAAYWISLSAAGREWRQVNQVLVLSLVLVTCIMLNSYQADGVGGAVTGRILYEYQFDDNLNPN